MATLRPMPIMAAVASACLLQACATPPAPPRAMKVEPVLQVQNSTDQSAATYYRLGKFQQERGNIEAARASYAQSIGLDRRQIEARNALAVLISADGKLDDAKAMLVQLVRDYPKVAYLYNNLAYVYFLRGEPDAAIPALEQALALEPGNARALNNLGLVQTALAEKRDRLTAALGLADVIAEKAGGASSPSSLKTVEPAATSAAALAKQTALFAPPPAGASPLPMESQTPQSSMEVVQVLPNVIELRRRQAPAPVMAERRQERVDKPAAAEVLVSAPPPKARPFRFDVANGNGIPGMALKMRDALARLGIQAGHVSNKRPFNTQNTEIQYLAGYEKEAERVRSAMAARVTMTPVSDISGSQDVRLVLGKDAASHAALMGEGKLVAYNDRQTR